MQLEFDYERPRRRSSFPACQIHMCKHVSIGHRYMVDGHGTKTYCSSWCVERMAKALGMSVIGESSNGSHFVLSIGDKPDYTG